jgi:hypothetical protein
VGGRGNEARLSQTFEVHTPDTPPVVQLGWFRRPLGYPKLAQPPPIQLPHDPSPACAGGCRRRLQHGGKG